MKQKAYAKVNIFLKIVGIRGNYHELVSRFYRIDSLYDEIEFIKNDASRFEIIGCEGIKREENTIYKAFCALNEATNNPELIDFFYNHSVKVTKNIPSFAGLGGGSSDAATFMLMCNRYIDLRLSRERLLQIALQIGADVAFFVSGYKSANVEGVGELIEEFEDDELKFQIITPPIQCSTAKVYAQFRKNYLPKIDKSLAYKLKSLKSGEILKQFRYNELNDLLQPAIELYPSLREYSAHNRYFSGSGSSFFNLIQN